MAQLRARVLRISNVRAGAVGVETVVAVAEVLAEVVEGVSAEVDADVRSAASEEKGLRMKFEYLFTRGVEFIKSTAFLSLSYRALGFFLLVAILLVGVNSQLVSADVDTAVPKALNLSGGSGDYDS